MTWTSAKADAERRIAALPLPEGRLDGLHVTLTDYADEATYQFATGSQAGTFAYSKMVNSALFRILKKRGAWVITRQISLTDLLEWQKQPSEHVEGVR